MKLSILAISLVALLAASANVRAQQATPSQDVEQVIGEAGHTPEQPFSLADRPVYEALQKSKKELSDKYGIHWALEDTAIYQAASGGVDPNDAFVNTLGLFGTWKIFRSDDGKNFGGLGFQGEIRGNHIDPFTAMR